MSTRSIKIPKQTLYVIDKVVRKKLQKDKKKRASSAKSVGGSDLKFTLSPEPETDLDNVRGPRKSRSQYENGKTPNKATLDNDYTKGTYDEWYQTKEVYKKYKDKLVKCIKQEMKHNLLQKVSQEIEDYERKLTKVMISNTQRKKHDKAKSKLMKT
jgi:hypothetical protein